MENQGIENEFLLIKKLNGVLVSTLKGPLREFVHFLFPGQEGILTCQKGYFHEKPDLILTLNGEIKFISVKSGRSISVHEESLTTIIPFLRSLGVDNHILKTIVYFHYGDGTLDGTGPTRFTSNDLRRVMNSYFLEASHYLSKKEIVFPCLERFVFRGLEINGRRVDAVYYGNDVRAAFASREEIFALFARSARRHTGTINIGPFTYQPAVRNFYGYGNEEKRRNESEIKWRGLYFDLGEIRKRSLTFSKRSEPTGPLFDPLC